MRKLLLIVLIFLLIGAVSAHDDMNGTDDGLLKDTQYNSGIDDDGKTLEVGEGDYIPIGVDVDEAYSLNVYIDRHDCAVNGELENVTLDQIDIPTTVVIDDDVALAQGKHSIVYEFTFTNTTSIYRPEAVVSDSVVYFDFDFVRTAKNPQNAVYRFTSQFNIVKGNLPISDTIDLGEVNVTYSDSLSFELKGLTYADVEIYIDGEFFDSLETDENHFEEEIDTTKLAVGSYDFVCTVKSEKVRGVYDISAEASASMISINFAKSAISTTQNRYIATVRAKLNVLEYPDVNAIYIDGPPVEVTYTRSVPIRFEGEDAGNLTVYIDGEKVYDSSILLSWENTIYIPTKDSNGNYFDIGGHDITFEFVFSDNYARFNPEISWYNDALTFSFVDAKTSSAFLNDKYIIKSKLNIKEKTAQFIEIDSDAKATIVHTEDLSLKIEGLDEFYNLTVFVDDVEICDFSGYGDEIDIKTFYGRSSLEEANARDIKTGNHALRFEFAAQGQYSVDAEFKNGIMKFKFNRMTSDGNPDGVHYQMNTTLTVTEKPKTVHILNVKNHTYFDDTEFIVSMDVYEPEDDDDDDYDDEGLNLVGTQDVGIIVTSGDKVLYTGDDLMNVYDPLVWNYDFENELLPKAGTYTIKIINLADNTYDTAQFKVKKADRTFNRKYTSVEFDVLFTLDFSSCKGSLNSPCTITLDGKEKTINVKKSSSGKKEVLFTDIDPGTYTVTFTLKGNDIYNDVTVKSKVKVKKESPEIKAHKSGSNGLVIEIDISKSKSDAELTVSAGGQVKKFNVDKNTKRLTVEFTGLGAGYHDVDIEFAGNERYSSKKLTVPLEITRHSKPQVSEPAQKTNSTGRGSGNGNGGIGTGTGNSNVAGSGNGTYAGKISFNGKGFDGNLGSKGSGSGSGDGPKGYEITKNVAKKIDENANVLLIIMIAALVVWIFGFIYERRDDDEEEY